MSNISYGDAVACINDGDISFGVVTEIAVRTNKDGERTEFVIEGQHSDGSPSRAVVTDEALIREINPDYLILHGDKVRDLLKHCPSYEHALARAKEIANPTPVTPSVGTGTHVAGDPAEPRNDADVPL